MATSSAISGLRLSIRIGPTSFQTFLAFSALSRSSLATTLIMYQPSATLVVVQS